MLTAVQELEQKTMAFWNLSSIWNETSKHSTTTGEAICICTDILQQTSFTRPLSYCVDRLLQQVIKGEGSSLRDNSVVVSLRA